MKNKNIKLVLGTLDLLGYPKQQQDADHVESRKYVLLSQVTKYNKNSYHKQ